jgi:hypothetical protein
VEVRPISDYTIARAPGAAGTEYYGDRVGHHQEKSDRVAGLT